MKDALPLPSVCLLCHTTIHAVHARSEERGSFSRKRVVLWLHDAPLATIIRRGGTHDAMPDPSYQPQRARVVGPSIESIIDATRLWMVTPLAA